MTPEPLVRHRGECSSFESVNSRCDVPGVSVPWMLSGRLRGVRGLRRRAVLLLREHQSQRRDRGEDVRAPGRRDLRLFASDRRLRGRPGPDGGPPLLYQIQTATPENWIPFLPVSVDKARGTVALERAAVLSAAGGLTGPAGRLLAPTVPVWEEEVPRTGVTVSRVVVRSRWLDGTTHLWVSRRTATGSGEASSGLAFDQAAAAPPS